MNVMPREHAKMHPALLTAMLAHEAYVLHFHSSLRYVSYLELFLLLLCLTICFADITIRTEQSENSISQ